MNTKIKYDTIANYVQSLTKAKYLDCALLMGTSLSPKFYNPPESFCCHYTSYAFMQVNHKLKLSVPQVHISEFIDIHGTKAKRMRGKRKNEEHVSPGSARSLSGADHLQ